MPNTRKSNLGPLDDTTPRGTGNGPATGQRPSNDLPMDDSARPSNNAPESDAVAKVADDTTMKE
jgi:hypothetical protein